MTRLGRGISLLTGMPKEIHFALEALGGASSRRGPARAGLFVSRMWLLGAAKAEVFSYVCRKPIFDFGMSRHGLFLAGPRIEVNVVPRPRA